MNKLSRSVLLAFSVIVIAGSQTQVSAKTVKIFILAGQSNMEGHGAIASDKNDGKGSLSYLADNNPKYKHLRKGKNDWVERDDVSISYLARKGALKPGFGARDSKIGPELGFGHVVGDAIDEPVLLIKTAWGGKSLAVDFRPPSSGGQVGPFYTQMVSNVNNTLENLKKEFPKLGSDYEIVGFGWHQGWNDGCDMAMCQEYEKNMQNFIRDVRKEFATPDLPFVIADSGFGGGKETTGRRFMIRDAQAAAAKVKSLNNVHCVVTGSFARPVEASPSKQGYHWNSNAETYYLVGEAMGKSMMELVGSNIKPEKKVRAELYNFRNNDGSKSFKARFKKYDEVTGKVTVIKANGSATNFKIDFLHPDDQKYVKEQN
ncbi:MAG: hypothetical protein ACI9E1_000554 [Cryomorphaceae bacterium]|jgi:hypothetical protein